MCILDVAILIVLNRRTGIKLIGIDLHALYHMFSNH